MPNYADRKKKSKPYPTFCPKCGKGQGYDAWRKSSCFRGTCKKEKWQIPLTLPKSNN